MRRCKEPDVEEYLYINDFHCLFLAEISGIVASFVNVCHEFVQVVRRVNVSSYELNRHIGDCCRYWYMPSSSLTTVWLIFVSGEIVSDWWCWLVVNYTKD